MWTCKYCESLNIDTANKCIICQELKHDPSTKKPEVKIKSGDNHVIISKPTSPSLSGSYNHNKSSDIIPTSELVICQNCGKRNNYTVSKNCTDCYAALLPQHIINCPFCNSSMRMDLPKCPSCRKPIKKKKCKSCKTLTPVKLNYCTNCGRKMKKKHSGNPVILIALIFSILFMLFTLFIYGLTETSSSPSDNSAELYSIAGGELYDLPEMRTAHTTEISLSMQQLQEAISGAADPGTIL